MARDARVDAYLAKAPDFARPILVHIRGIFHAAAPGLDEDIKWGMPAFMWNGRQIATMAAFKHHAALAFWLSDVAGAKPRTAGAMGQFGKLKTLGDLPTDARLGAMVEASIAHIESGVLPHRAVKHAKAPLEMPKDFADALDSARARAAFDTFPPGAQREYLEWILSAKQQATRARRIALAVAQTEEGKRLHWKYQGR